MSNGATTVHGLPTILGAAHAAALRERIHTQSLPFVRQAERLFRTPYERILEHALEFERAVPEEYREEMRALAEAAEVDYREIAALNTFLDTDCLCEAETVWCVNAVAWGEATADGSLLHARNLDFPSGGYAQRMAAVFHYRPACGHAFLSVGWAGIVGAVTGMNDCGLTVTEITSRTRTVSPKGMPLMILLRQLLQYAGSIEEAVEIIRSSPRTGGFNVTLTDWRGPEAVVVEFDAEQVAVRRGSRGLLVGSENRLTPALARGQRLSPSGVARHIRACDLLERDHGRITADTMIALLRDRWDPILRQQGQSHNAICNANTVQAVVFVPAEGRALVANTASPAPEGDFGEYRVGELADP